MKLLSSATGQVGRSSFHTFGCAVFPLLAVVFFAFADNASADNQTDPAGTAPAASSGTDGDADITKAVEAFRKAGRNFSGAKLARGVGECSRINTAAISEVLGVAVEVHVKKEKEQSPGNTYRQCALLAAKTSVVLFQFRITNEPDSEEKVVDTFQGMHPWRRVANFTSMTPIEGLAERAAWARDNKLHRFTTLLVREGTVEAVIEGRTWDRAKKGHDPDRHSPVSVPLLIDALERIAADMAL